MHCRACASGAGAATSTSPRRTALVASKGKSAYVAAKHGITGLTKTVALECAEDGVTANATCPNFVRTELVDKQIRKLAASRGLGADEVAGDFVGEKHPSRNFVRATDAADFAVFLCSEAAASITGAVLPIDGGWTAQ
ncbi:MAG: SDR family oxidoreductase [Rhodospirillaceae bacterium]